MYIHLQVVSPTKFKTANQSQREHTLFLLNTMNIGSPFTLQSKVHATLNSLFTPHKNFQEYPNIAKKIYEYPFQISPCFLLLALSIRLSFLRCRLRLLSVQTMVDGSAGLFGLSATDEPRP